MADVAVVVGNYEGAALLPDLFASLEAQTQHPVETIVVDANSDDASVAVAEAAGARVLSVPNLGLGFLYNRGVEASSAAYALLLNNDVALAPDCIAQLAAALDDEPTRFAADPVQLDWAGERVIHARTTLTRGRMTHEYLPGLHLDHLVPATATAPTVCANGAAMLVRRDLFRQLGGFDETFFLEWEDLDLCWRAWTRGHATVHVPDARVRHRVGAVTAEAAQPARSASSHHNLVRFALKCLPAPAAARVVAGELLRLPRHPQAVARGLAAVVPELAEIRRLRRTEALGTEAFERLSAGIAAGEPAQGRRSDRLA